MNKSCEDNPEKKILKFKTTGQNVLNGELMAPEDPASEVNLLRVSENSYTLQGSALPRGSPVSQGGFPSTHLKQTETTPRKASNEICCI